MILYVDKTTHKIVIYKIKFLLQEPAFGSWVLVATKEIPGLFKRSGIFLPKFRDPVASIQVQLQYAEFLYQILSIKNLIIKHI